ncbi:MAG TPA: hypothetical protein VND24_04200 [Steroidobacteraceae bacterium]|nr:hypothetical protein [Steroidobacteraceae bacterium]
MKLKFAVRLALTAVAVASTAIVLLHTLGAWSLATLPLDIEQSGNHWVVHPLLGVALPPPLVAGDFLAPKEMSTAARAVVFNGLGVPPGSSVVIAVAHGGRILRISIPARPARPFRRDWLHRLLVAFVVTPFTAVLALLTLWRGRDRVAAGLCVLSLFLLIGSALLNVSIVLAEPLLSVWFFLLVYEGQFLVAFPALYVMAEGLAGAGLSARNRTFMRAILAAVILVGFGISLSGQIAGTVFGLEPSAMISATVSVATIVAIVIPVLMLLVGYRRAPHANRLRIRWVLLSTGYLVVCAAAILLLAPVQNRYPNLFEFVYTARMFAFAGYLYAAIRTRLVDVSFVINRALVYAGITGLLFGIFSLLELGLHQLAVGEKLSWALQAIAALLLAVALSPLHRRLEHWVERIFFRRQRLAIESVRRFAAECAFIEQQSRLLDTAVERLQPHCAGVAVYERALSGYQLRAAGGHTWPASIDVDDPAFVSLRARRREIDLHELGSAIGPDSFVFPMIVGEQASGAVVCRPPAGERFAPDVRAALAEASHNLGASLYILRFREQARLVADIATGRVDEVGARRRAVAMLEGAG